MKILEYGLIAIGFPVVCAVAILAALGFLTGGMVLICARWLVDWIGGDE